MLHRGADHSLQPFVTLPLFGRASTCQGTISECLTVFYCWLARREGISRLGDSWQLQFSLIGHLCYNPSVHQMQDGVTDVPRQGLNPCLAWVWLTHGQQLSGPGQVCFGPVCWKLRVSLACICFTALREKAESFEVGGVLPACFLFFWCVPAEMLLTLSKLQTFGMEESKLSCRSEF